MNVDETVAGRVQFVHPMRAVLHDQLAEHADVRRFPSRPVSHDDVGIIENFIPAVPGRKSEKRVHTDNQTQRTVRKFLAQRGNRIDRVRRAATAQLAVISRKPVLRGNRNFNETKALLGRCIGNAAVRRIAAWHETHLGKIQRLQHFECGPQVPVVNGIKRATEDADGIHVLAISMTMSAAICHGSPKRCPLAAASARPLVLSSR